MKICFYFDNSRRPDIDYSNPENGNPGIGGTEYMIWSVSYYLKKIYDDFEIVLFAPIIDKLPKETVNIKCSSIYEAINMSKKINCDVLVIRNRAYDKNIYELIDELEINTIVWSHNFEKYDSVKYAAKCKYVKRNVCVSKEQYDRLRDHEIYRKFTYIYNALDFKNYTSEKYNTNVKKNILCYVGAIKPTKSFHILAKNWDKIVERIPDIELYVIGGGNLYDRNAKLGRYNIAEENYEKEFIDYIVDSNGKIKDNIKFLGVLGENEKLDIMSKAKIGIVNPIAKDETFCISAIEFEALGIPVVARKRYGLLDTVDDKKSGILFKSEKEMIDAIEFLIRNKNTYEKMCNYSYNYVREKFDIYSICNEWNNLLQDVVNNVENKELKYTNNYSCDIKWIREINRRIKYIKLFKSLPAILEYPECIYDNKVYLICSKLKSKILYKIKN